MSRMATETSEKSSSGRGGGARKRGGGVGEEAAVDAAIQAVEDADKGNQQPLAAMGGRVVQAESAKITEAQVRLIIKRLEAIDGFDDPYSMTFRSQLALFEVAVKSVRPDVPVAVLEEIIARQR